MGTISKKVSAISIGSAILLAAGIAGCGTQNQYAPPPPPDVTVSLPVRRSITDYVEYTGTAKAVETVELRARVKGFLKERHFEEGNVVKEGQLLLVIDEEPFQVALNMAQAQLDEAEAALKKAEQSKDREVAQAQLALDQAILLLARIEEGRSKTLLARNAGTREALDQAEANRKKSEAQVEADQAKLEQVKADYQTNILSAKAHVEATRSDVRNAQINLGYCRITAPFEGRISRRAYDVGNLVGDGQATILATILKDDPIYSYVNVSENDLLRFRQMAREGTHKDFEHGDEIILDLGLANEKGFPHRGKLDYADPSVDPASGTVLARGIYPNPDRVIVPGLFVRVRVALEEKPNALLVPELALGTNQLGRYLLIVDEKDTVEARPVKVGSQVGTFRVIEDNLKPEELVIVSGLQKARPGSKVKPTRKDQTAPTVAGTSEPVVEANAEPAKTP
ncbi:efflux RND transporter periplasmic adaptor subunit [Tundrisphaera lichenicola]|uniref:efflux RND transporter periplasmic adaptor subunit n=1 Tax=Tundrisphaera lichenicola TaxID=2029860 RepID=UPI003EBC5C91